VVSGNEHDLAPVAEALPEITEHWLRGRKRLLGAALHQLDDVAEQHQSVYVAKRAEQPPPRLGTREHVVPQAAAKVKV
jgi:hypothetical protein